MLGALASRTLVIQSGAMRRQRMKILKAFENSVHTGRNEENEKTELPRATKVTVQKKDSKSKKHLKELRLLRIQTCYRNQLAVRKTMLLETEQEQVHDFEDNGFQHSKQYIVGVYNRAMIQTE